MGSWLDGLTLVRSLLTRQRPQFCDLIEYKNWSDASNIHSRNRLGSGAERRVRRSVKKEGNSWLDENLM